MADTSFVLTGAPGSGKSTVVASLRTLGFSCVDEPARQILAEQRSIDGAGVPERDPRLFIELMLSRAIHEYREQECARVPPNDRASFILDSVLHLVCARRT